MANLKTIPLAAALALSPFAQGPAAADDAPFLPTIATTTTIPSNGDLNPYGIAFVPPNFSKGKGPLLPGDILVSNFNASGNVQGTGTTIIQYRPSPSGAVAPPPSNPPSSTQPGASVFFQENGQLPGLTLALGVLQRGAIVVGIVNNSGTSSNPIVSGGPLLVIDPNGKLLTTIPARPGSKLNGPWGLAIADHFSTASLFVSNVLDGTVTRLDVSVSSSGNLNVTKATTIASGYGFRPDAAALELGPAGLAYEAATDTLYVASEVDNAIFKVTNASTRTGAGSPGTGTVFVSGATNKPPGGNNLRGPVGLTLAPNGHVIASNSDAVNGDLAHPSEIVEFTHDGNFVGEYNVNEAQGAAFGVAVGAPNAGGIANFAAVNDVSNNMSVYALPIKLATFACSGQPGDPNCHGQCVSDLAKTYGGINNAASALGFASVAALQNGIDQFCTSP